jgi:hypothetical protein
MALLCKRDQIVDRRVHKYSILRIMSIPVIENTTSRLLRWKFAR